MRNQSGFGPLYILVSIVIITLIGGVYFIGTQKSNQVSNTAKQELNS